MAAISLILMTIPQCGYTESEAYIMKIPGLCVYAPTLQMFASRVQPGLQILSAANFVCNLCNRYLKLLQLSASAVL